VLNGPAGLPNAVVAWVSVVVGVHFLMLAAIWRLRLFRVLLLAAAYRGVTRAAQATHRDASPVQHS